MDRVANTIVALRNASAVSKETTMVAYSTLVLNILTLLKKEGYIKAFNIMYPEDVTKRKVEVVLEYISKNMPRIREVARVSKASTRVYVSASKIPVYKSGKGLVVLSTPKGILTGREAKKEHVGGEVLFTMF
jgi:small subunit ribosomal protein S8